MRNRMQRMPQRRREPRLHGVGGFTLIEMVMVIALIGIVMTVVGGFVVNHFNQGKYAAGKAAVHMLEIKLQSYMVHNGSPPASLNDLVTRPASAKNWLGPYAKPGDLTDPFGHPFVYKLPGSHGDYDIVFLGKDGKEGGEGLDKDVGNWE